MTSLSYDVEWPREVAWGGVTGVAIWLAANAFKKVGPQIGFGAIGLGAAANAVSMAVGIPVAAGYVASYAIGGSEGIENFEHFLTHPLDMPFNVAMSAAVIYEHYSNLPGNSGEFDALEFEGVTPGVM